MSKTKKILLATDSADISHILTSLLHSWGYDVITTDNGDDALKLSRSEFPDLVVLDAALTKVDGLEASRILKGDFITAYIPIILLMDKRQFRRNLLEVKQGIDDFLTKPPDPIDFEIRIALALRNSEHKFHANPLTKLPGNRAIEAIIDSAIEDGRVISVAHADINNFKAFNDKYGYVHGDAVIMQTASILSKVVKKYGNLDDFVGHIGGDDFVIITTPEREGIIAGQLVNEFDRLIPFHYSKEDRGRGFITVKGRTGSVANFALMGIAISIVNNQNQKINSSFEWAQIISEIKTYLKGLNRSGFLVNRRSSNCGINKRQKARLGGSKQAQRVTKMTNAKPLGQLLLDEGIIDEGQLNEALKQHWKTGQFLGQTLIDMGFVTPVQLEKFINPFA